MTSTTASDAAHSRLPNGQRPPSERTNNCASRLSVRMKKAQRLLLPKAAAQRLGAGGKLQLV
jgi:hypothetical protein